MKKENVLDKIQKKGNILKLTKFYSKTSSKVHIKF